jgi:hypothetical protein
MSSQTRDPLLERVRAADPTVGDVVPAGIDLARISALRRAEAARRRRRGVLGTVTLAVLLATVALVLPLGGRGPSDDSILLDAAQASELPPNSIVVVERLLTSRSSVGGFRARHISWLRTSASGRVLTWRDRTVSATDAAMRLADASSGRTRDGAPYMTTYDWRTRHATRIVNAQLVAPDLLATQMRRYVTAARSSGRHTTIDGPATIDGRRVYRIHITTRSAPREREARELVIDARTFKPLAMHYDSYKRALDNKPAFLHVTERILSERTLPDTPRNRRFLRAGGPVR